MVFDFKSVRLEKINLKKLALKNYLIASRKIFDNLINDWFRVETTYSSNALEGNTLSKMQTEVVINKGITISGKTIVEHLEAINHAASYDFIVSLSGDIKECKEQIILDIHFKILKSIDDQNAGRYRNISVRISGSNTILPNHLKVSSLMQKFIQDLELIKDPIHKAIFAHYQLVTIHPFSDGNGRTARLLMNYILIKNDYPPLIIAPKDRLKYLRALEMGQTKYLYTEYIDLMLKLLEKSIDFCLDQYQENKDEATGFDKKLKIGQLAKKANISISTIRHWLELGLVKVLEVTDSGYQIFSNDAVEKCRRILELKSKRFTLAEIKELLDT
jgi:Fic family protein